MQRKVTERIPGHKSKNKHVATPTDWYKFASVYAISKACVGGPGQQSRRNEWTMKSLRTRITTFEQNGATVY